MNHEFENHINSINTIFRNTSDDFKIISSKIIKLDKKINSLTNIIKTIDESIDNYEEHDDDKIVFNDCKIMIQEILDKYINKYESIKHQQLKYISLINKYKKLMNTETEYICSICLENKINIVFTCGHTSCENCSNKVDICHICRQNINNKINFYP